jgi:F-type H+-transporting ATPase subunit b
MKQAQSAIESEKRAAVAELKNQVAELSIEIAEKVTKEVLSEDKKQAQLVQKLLKDVSIK